MSKIHPTAVIEEGAVLGKNVEVGPYTIVSRHVVLEDDVVVKAHVFLDGHTRIGKGDRHMAWSSYWNEDSGS